MSLKMCLIALIFFTFSCATLTHASSEMRVYQHFDEIMQTAEKLQQKAKNNHILMVYDIDNTLLTGAHPLATSEWFDWQAGLIKENNGSKYRVANNILSLVDIQVDIFNWAGLQPVEPNNIKSVMHLKNLGYPSIVLTARSDDMFPATLREFARNGLWFADDDQLIKNQRFYINNNQAAAPIVLQGSIIMASGQNKGLALQQLLSSAKYESKYIIFVDDVEKNVKDMAKIFEKDPHYHVIAVHYTYSEPNVIKFKAMDKLSIHTDYLEFANLKGKLQPKM